MKSLRTVTAENHITFSISADGEERSLLCASFHITTGCFFNKLYIVNLCFQVCSICKLSRVHECKQKLMGSRVVKTIEKVGWAEMLICSYQ